eukprot:tig00022075_g23593.t1
MDPSFSLPPIQPGKSSSGKRARANGDTGSSLEAPFATETAPPQRLTRSADSNRTDRNLFDFSVEEVYKYDLNLGAHASSRALTHMSPRFRSYGRSSPVTLEASREGGLSPKRARSVPKSSLVSRQDKQQSPPSIVTLPLIRDAFMMDRAAPVENGHPATQLGGSVAPGHEDSEESEELKTGNDAIAFFARYGQNSPVKFVYMNRARTGDNFRPYDLIIVSREEVEPEHFTMSASGVVHIRPGEPSEFIPLGEWVRQATMFNVLTSIPYFKYYLIAKSFRLWRSNVRFKLYCQQRSKLTKRLFLAKPSFCSTLLEINRLCVDIREVDLMHISSKRIYQPDEFNEQQVQQRNQASKKFEQVVDKLQALLEKVCEDVNARARTSDDLLLGASGEADASGDGNPSTRQTRGEKSKSMVAVKQEQAARMKALKQAIAEAQMLGDFVRLADYMSVESLSLLTLTTMDKFLNILEVPRKTGLFFTTVGYGTSGMVFTPGHDDIAQLINNMEEGMINTVNLVPRLLYMRPFKPYFNGASVVGPHVGSMIRQSEKFIDIKQKCDEVIARDFSQAVDYSKTFEEYRQIYTFGETWNYEEYEKAPHTVKEFKSDMDRMKRWQGDLEKMKLSNVLGVLHVDSKRLKNQLVPITSKALESMKQLLLQTARDKCIEVTQDFQNRIKQLQDKPRTLREFADFVSTSNQMKEDGKLLQARAQTVNDMYDLLSKYEVKVPSQDQVKRDSMHEQDDAFKDALEQAQQQVDSKMPSMAMALDKGIEALNNDLLATLAQLHSGDYVDGNADAEIVLEKLAQLKDSIDQMAEKGNTFQNYQKLFNLSAYEFGNLHTTLQQFDARKELWETIQRWEGMDRTWRSSDFSKLNVDEMSTEVQTCYKNAFRMWKRKEDDEVAKRLKDSVEVWKAWMPMVLELGNKALKSRHWEKIFRVLGQTYFQGMSFTLDQLIRYNIFDHRELISEISGVASGEYGLEITLEKIKTAWATMEFTTLGHRDSKDVFILGGVDEVSTLLEDNQVTLQTMMASRFVVGIREEIDTWDKKLSTLSECLDEWLQCQRNWMYLESIFGQPDIQKQLPAETAKFMKVDNFWKELMRKTHDNPNVINISCSPGVLDNLVESNRLLEEVQKSLEEYLETKRVAFPRFYFLSNDELLEILSQTREPKAVQPHLRKCFDNILMLDFEEGGDEVEITAMYSAEKERVEFSNVVYPRGPVENWLLEIEAMMKSTLYDKTKAALKTYSEETREQWFFDWPSQMVLTVDQIVWTHNVEVALEQIQSASNKMAMHEYKKFCISQLERMVALVRGQLTPLERSCMGSLIVIDVHARDVLDILIKANCEAVTDFDWIRQLRYYWEEDVDNCVVRQTNASFLYGYEYLGNQPRLVITPLTDKCYMTLTGKTETTKDLGKALARQCVVFNCSDGLDYKMMGRFFAGLSQAGAWACFDEFNRIDIEVLSVIAQQCLCIQQALVAHAERFIFEGREISLNPNYGCFITMNPGYAGRTELPDNLKALFRPVAMMVPDYALIAEIMLFSEGFTDAKNLARKMTQLYKLSSEQLSSQDHYDFGMRAVKSVLVMAGSLKRSFPDTSEDIVLIRALRDSNVPKFLADDVPLFFAIIRDLFPGVTIPNIDYGDLQHAIENQLSKKKLQVEKSIVTKTIQLYETMQVRHGVMMVGVTSTGKSTVVTTLADAMTQLCKDGSSDANHQAVHRYTLNPKSITMGELYGEFNLVSNEWTDGLIASLVRQCVADELPDKKWVVFDGPVDALWIENMNTVLDDNKTLCLANGERIKLPKTVSMLFEVNDLAVASPATVSRCGMVYMEPVHLPWRALAKTWGDTIIEPRLQGVSTQLLKWLETVVDPSIAFIRHECRENIPSMDISLVVGFCNLLDVLLRPELGVSVPTITEMVGGEKQQVRDNSPGAMMELTSTLKLYFVFAYIWSIGANVHDVSREKFDRFARPLINALTSDFPEEGSVYDYCVDMETKKFIPWATRVPDFKYESGTPYFNMLVHTEDTTRVAYVVSKLVSGGFNALITGSSGVGKTVVLQDFLNGLSKESWVFAQTTLSAQTSSKNIQDFMEDKLEKRRKNLLGPISGKRMVFFLDDLNMPLLEKYGAQPPIELLRQAIGHGGFYDRKKLFFKNIADTQFLAGCAPPGGGRNNLTPRLVRHFHLINMPDLSVASMKRIFECIISGFLSDGFSSELMKYGKPIVDASVAVYCRIASELLPTPSKSHYTFNLRDLSKVFQGILQVMPKNIDEGTTLVKLWCHECARVFQDRLIDDTDKSWFDNLIKELLQQNFELEWDVMSFQGLLFGDYLTREEKEYKMVTDIEALSKLLAEYLEDYTVTYNKTMNLVFFRDAIEHISRISRIIRQPRGNALLVGVGGSGRQSLTRLAAHMSDYKCFQIELTRHYGMNEFREDLKKVLFMSGAENKQVVFLFSDTQIVKESFLEDINNVLNAGEVPNLFPRDEMDRIINMVRPLAKAAGKSEAKDVVYAHFVQLVRENLHVVLTMSPIGDKFRNRLRMFPSLVNCCTIDWFSAWPEEALYSVAMRFLGTVDLGGAEVTDKVCRLCVMIHFSVKEASRRFYEELRRHNYTTPTSYLELINLYVQMLQEQRGVLAGKIVRLRGGLDKIAKAKIIVDRLREELKELQPVLEESAQATANLLVEVAADQKAADEVKANVEEETVKVAAATEEAEAIRSDAQADLDEALPAFYSAVKALKSLNKNDITEVKSFAKPPPLVMTVMEAVCILKGVKPTWDESKKLLSDTNFLQSLENYDKDNISEAIVQKLKKYVTNPEFQPATVEKVSKAAKSLCQWVLAMNTYARVAKSVEPKRAKLAQAESSLKQMQQLLEEKRQKLADVEAKVAMLQEKYERSLKKRDELEHQKQLTVLRLERAEKLISGLGGEEARWTSTAIAYETDRDNLVGNILLAAGCVAYVGPFTATFRKQLEEQWKAECNKLGIPVDPNFTVERTLGEPVQIRDWNIQGLPADSLSVENAIFVTRGRRWPLMIDPQGQANRWIKNMERANNLQVIKLSDSTYMRTIENCVRVGTPILLENVGEHLDPALEPILLKQVFKQAGRLLIRLGDSDVDYSPDFRFYITTKLANPHYPPEICVKVTIVNFTVILKGLEDQLLVDVVKAERPDLEELKDKLVVQIASGQKQLKEIEDKILQLLAAAGDDILDDDNLINTLSDSKVKSTEINQQVEAAEKTAKEIDIAREGYRSVAIRGSILYFVVADFAVVDPMYQYSLQYFTQLFNQCLEKAERSTDLQTRLANLISFMTDYIFANICRGLFEKDKMLFSFMIAVQIHRQAGNIAADEWSFFLRGGQGLLDAHSHGPNPSEKWLPSKVWAELQNLSTLPSFKGLVDSIINDNEMWRSLYESDTPHQDLLPGQWNEKLSDFAKLLILKVMREEKLVFGLPLFVSRALGASFIEFPPFDLETSYNASANRTPIIFVLSSGADPTTYLLNLATKRSYGDRLKIISLGQGQGPIAEALIEAARKNGDWVCLQNCHLAASWMPALDRLLEQMQQMDVHDDFRLWLTSMPSSAFPVTVLQNGIKLTNEPPKGLKANLQRTFLDMDESVFESCSKPREWKKLLFGLAFYHACIMERRKFGAVGWNIPYEWTQSDLQVSIQMLKMYLEEQAEVPYVTLNYVTAEVNYGGRITDMWDQRCAKSILANYYCEDILTDSYAFTDDGIYRAPPEGDLKSFRDFIAGLPMTDNPEIFGLHRNADINFQKKETHASMNTIIMLQPRVSGKAAGGKSPDEIVADLAQEIHSKLPAKLSREDVHEKTFELDGDGAMNSLGTFLSIEMAKFNRLLATMDKSLDELKRAIKGLVVMSADLEMMFNNMLYQKVPHQWSNVAYPSLKPLGAWVSDLLERVEFLRKWLKDGPPNAFWISGFFFPQGFMTGALQTYARKTKIPIDSLTFRAEVTDFPWDGVTSQPENGTYIYGLYMEGARWDKIGRCINESQPGELFTPMPVMWMEPVPLDAPKTPNMYTCPVYKISTRAGTLSTTGHSTNFVTTVELPSRMHPDHWIRRGVALLSNLDE